MKKNKIILLYSAILLSIIGASCNKFLETDPPKDQVNSKFVFENDRNALAALTGMYIRMPGYLKFELGMYTALYADELAVVASETEHFLFYESHVPYDLDILNYYWNDCYRFIYIANSNIEGIAASSGITDSLKKQFTGEALFFRAFTYLTLTNLFGPVPLVKSTAYQENLVLPQSSVDSVYTSIVDDLLQARTLLKETYPSKEKIRVNKWAATALLARVYLYMGNWKEAGEMSNEIIRSQQYGALPPSEKVFLLNSPEAILHLASNTNAKYVSDAYNYIPAASDVVPRYTITEQLENAMEAGDKRKENWLGFNTVEGKKYFYPSKYKNNTGGTVTEYFMLLRLAEQYLIRAEAYAHSDQFNLAVSDLNVVRQRAGIELIPPATIHSREQLLDLILHERRVEFFTESGHRWFDLKRSGKAIEVMRAQKPATWRDKALLWPIPMTQLDNNPFLQPNSGN